MFRFAPRTAPQCHGSVRGVGKPPGFAVVQHGSPNGRSTPLFFSVRDIFSHTFDTLAQQVSFPFSSAYEQIVFADSRIAAAFHLAQLSQAHHLQKDCIFTTSLYSPTLAHPPPSSHFRLYFSCLCLFSVFDGHSFAAFAYS